MGRIFAKYFAFKLFFAAWALLTLSPLLLMMWLAEGHEKLRAVLVWITLPLGIACFVMSWWLAGSTVHYLFDENMMFLDSVKQAVWDLKLKLAFVPIIGQFFTPDEDMTKPDDDEPVQ